MQPNAGQLLRQLYQMIAATREAQEADRQHREAWEEQHKLEVENERLRSEKRILELQAEVASLRAHIEALEGTSTPHLVHAPSPPSTSGSSTTASTYRRLLSPISPPPQSDYYTRQRTHPGSSLRPSPESVQGISADHLLSFTSSPPSPAPQFHPRPISFSQSRNFDPATFDLSHFGPSSSAVIGSAGAGMTSPSSLAKGKQKRPSVSTSSEGDSDSCVSSSGYKSPPPRKRINHHDKRCLTIQVSSAQSFDMLP